MKCALERGHQVTIFNRGRSAPGMPGKDVEELAGDRAAELTPLKGRKWTRSSTSRPRFPVP
ncbi:MAG: hypothetical protein IPK33_10000 [Gemmatimonadetes bacterium]|nr:hypothetical protein [Gemmatimonadota bacterium]